jgi:hypothetical protein
MASVSSGTVYLLSQDSQNTLTESDEPTDTSLCASGTVGRLQPGPGVTPLSQTQPDNHPTDHTRPLKEYSGHAQSNSRANSVENGLPTAESTEKEPDGNLQRRAFGFKSWAWEVVNAVLLFIMIIATVITLRLHDGQPVPDWPFSITINAMVSTYALVFKSNVALILTSCIGQFQWSWYQSRHLLGDVALFQDAGRSPWGALVWLCRLHLRQPIVALAALVTILGITIDPFFQQLAQPSSCHAYSGALQKPSLPRTNYLDISVVSSQLNSSIAAGFYQPPNLSALGCSTGNCTFDTEYSTLAFCSKCEDVSDQSQIELDCLNQFIETNDRSQYNLSHCNQSVGMDVDVNQRLSTSWKLRANNQPIRDLRSALWNTNLTLGVDYSILRAKSFGFQRPWTGCEDVQKNNTWECRGYGAAKCSIQPCVRTYTANIESSQLHES